MLFTQTELEAIMAEVDAIEAKKLEAMTPEQRDAYMGVEK